MPAVDEATEGKMSFEPEKLVSNILYTDSLCVYGKCIHLLISTANFYKKFIFAPWIYSKYNDTRCNFEKMIFDFNRGMSDCTSMVQTEKDFFQPEFDQICSNSG